MIGYHLELAARAHQEQLLREAHNRHQVRMASRDGHSHGQHQLVAVVLALLLGTALLLI